MYLIATHRPQSLFGEVTKHQAHIFRNRACGVSLRRQSNCTANASALVSESAIISVIWQIQGLKSSRRTLVSQSRKHFPYLDSLCSTTGGGPGQVRIPFPSHPSSRWAVVGRQIRIQSVATLAQCGTLPTASDNLALALFERASLNRLQAHHGFTIRAAASSVNPGAASHSCSSSPVAVFQTRAMPVRVVVRARWVAGCTARPKSQSC